MRLTDEAGADHADADAVLLQHVADALAPHADRGLAGIVGRRVGQADEARQRRHDGDLAALARHHAADQRLDGVEHAVDIDRRCVLRMTEKSSSEELSLSIEMPALAITQIDRMGIVEARQPGGERRAVDDVDPCRHRRSRPWRGRPRRRPRGAPASRPRQRQRDAGRGIVERQRLADAARGAGDDDARESLHGITFRRLRCMRRGRY